MSFSSRLPSTERRTRGYGAQESVLFADLELLDLPVGHVALPDLDGLRAELRLDVAVRHAAPLALTLLLNLLHGPERREARGQVPERRRREVARGVLRQQAPVD